MRAQLYIGLDVEYINQNDFDKLHVQAEEVSRLLHSLIKKVKSSPHQGLQHKKEQSKSDAFLEQVQDQVKKQRGY